MNELEKEKIVNYLKDLILNKGLNYLSDNSTEVFNKVETESNLKSALFVCLFNGVCKKALEENITSKDLSSYIESNCMLNKEASSYFADIFIEVFSKENRKEYDSKKEMGFNEFCNKKHNMTWDGFARWNNDGIYVDCSFKATFGFMVVDKEKVRKENKKELKENPYLSSKYFYDKYKGELDIELDNDFEYYCTCDDYYPPVAEDYIDNCQSLLEKYFDKHGFELLSFDGDGETSDYERY